MIPWIIIAVGVLLLYSSLKEGAKAWPSAAGAIVIGIGVVALGKSFGWLAIGAGVLGLMFLLIGLKAVTRLLAGLALIGMVLGGIVSIDFDDDDKTEASADDTPETTSTTVPAQDLGLTEEESQQLAADLAEIYQDFEPGEVNTGTGNIPDSPEERAPDVSFTKETIETREDLCTFFASDHEKAPDARARVEQALREAGYGDDEVNRALNSDCASWLWVAPTVDHQILGTTFNVNGEVVQSGNWRQVAPNDAIWFYVTSDAHIVAGASVRADCGNPNVVTIRPVRPDTPEAPPVDIPPGSPCPFNPALPVDSPNCLKPKDPSQDVLLNPDVPDQVKGPGTTPVGTDPGPPTPACDTPTGYCPGSEPTTTTTQPSGGSGGGGSGGGTTTTVPSCGQAGQPSCDNTGVSPPTTEAPPPAPPTTESPDDTIPSP